MVHPYLDYYVVIEKQNWRDAHEIFIEKKKFQSSMNALFPLTLHMGIGICVCLGTHKGMAGYKPGQ